MNAALNDKISANSIEVGVWGSVHFILSRVAGVQRYFPGQSTIGANELKKGITESESFFARKMKSLVWETRTKHLEEGSRMVEYLFVWLYYYTLHQILHYQIWSCKNFPSWSAKVLSWSKYNPSK